MGGNYADYKNKDKIKKQVKVKAGKIKRSLKNKKIGLKSKFFFIIFRMKAGLMGKSHIKGDTLKLKL